MQLSLQLYKLNFDQYNRLVRIHAAPSVMCYSVMDLKMLIAWAVKTKQLLYKELTWSRTLNLSSTDGSYIAEVKGCELNFLRSRLCGPCTCSHRSTYSIYM